MCTRNENFPNYMYNTLHTYVPTYTTITMAILYIRCTIIFTFILCSFLWVPDQFTQWMTTPTIAMATMGVMCTRRGVGGVGGGVWQSGGSGSDLWYLGLVVGPYFDLLYKT